MLLLITAAFTEGRLTPLMASFEGWWAFVPATINGVFTGAMYPANGDVWREVAVLSTAVLVTPVSSLVGIMLFKTRREWAAYVRLSLPIAAAWCLIVVGWFVFVWPLLDGAFYSVFPRPALAVGEAASH